MAMTREQIQREHIPADYSPARHVAALALSAAAAAGVCLWRLERVSAWQWLVPIGTIVLCNGGEYWLHRGPFHVPFKGPARELYKRHTTMHHAMFDHETMACDGARDLKWILLPAWGYAGVMAATAPIAAGLHRLAPNACWLFLLSMTGYYVVYELLHTAAHLPAKSRWADNPLIRAVVRHHTVHHDPRLMRRFNFNFALPLFDWLNGTIAPRSDERAPLREGAS